MRSILIALPRKPPCKANFSTRAPRTPLWTRRSREFVVRVVMVVMVVMVECCNIEICGLSRVLSGYCFCLSASSRVFGSFVFVWCFSPRFRRFSGCEFPSNTDGLCSWLEICREGLNSEC
jgi:hypothetical protein